MATKHAFIYCRISEDKQGRAEGVEAQEKWGQEYAAQHWPGMPVRVFADNDISGADEDAVRPGFDKLREGILAGDCAHVWAVEQSRLTRIESVWFGLVADLLKAGVDELHTNRDGVRRLDDVVGGIMAVIDAAEVRKLKKRINDKLGELAAQGRPGGAVPYGYRMGIDAEGRKTLEIVPEEAEVLRWAAERVLSGWSLNSVAKDLRARGMRGKYGGMLDGSVIKSMLTNASVAGHRTYRGEIVRRATWAPILNETTWRTLRAQLSTRTTVKNGNGTYPITRGRISRRRYLLTGGVAVCGLCGENLKSAWHSQSAVNAYSCEIWEKGCNRVTVWATHLESHVTEELFDHLAEPAFLSALSSDEHEDRRAEIIDELQAIDTSRGEWTAARDAKQLNLGEFLAAKAKFDEEEHRLLGELDALPTPVEKVDPARVRAAWPHMILDERRKLVTDWIDKVIVHPARDRRATQRMVAERVGMSVAAVCIAFGRGGATGGVSEDTRRRIVAAAAELGYEPADNRRQRFDSRRIEIVWK